MKTTKLLVYPATPQRSALALLTAATLSLIAVEQARAASAEPAKAAVATPVAQKSVAEKCLTDLSSFQVMLEKDGYWRGGSGYGYGYPMHGYAYDEVRPLITGTATPVGAAYWRARPGYEIRTLLASAQIMAQRGQQQACETLLSETREIYGRYAGELRSGKVPRYNASEWRNAQLAAAVPVDGQNVSFRSDQLIGTEVLSPKGDSLGSVNDLVLSPKTGQIAYLVIGRGGLFGINEKFVPVPWADFRATAGAKLLVLNTTKPVMSAAPQVKEDQFSATSDFEKQSQLVNAYWSTHLTK